MTRSWPASSSSSCSMHLDHHPLLPGRQIPPLPPPRAAPRTRPAWIRPCGPPGGSVWRRSRSTVPPSPPPHTYTHIRDEQGQGESIRCIAPTRRLDRLVPWRRGSYPWCGGGKASCGCVHASLSRLVRSWDTGTRCGCRVMRAREPRQQQHFLRFVCTSSLLYLEEGYAGGSVGGWRFVCGGVCVPLGVRVSRSGCCCVGMWSTPPSSTTDTRMHPHNLHNPLNTQTTEQIAAIL